MVRLSMQIVQDRYGLSCAIVFWVDCLIITLRTNGRMIVFPCFVENRTEIRENNMYNI